MGRPRRFGLVVVAAGLLCAGASGCGYTSLYTPPADGRARAVWRDHDAVLHLAGAQPSRECFGELTRLTAVEPGEVLPAPPPPRTQGGYWVPRYYGPPIVVLHPGLAPRPRLFLPPFVLGPRIGPVVGLPGVPFSPSLTLLHTAGGGDSGKALAYLAVIALIVLPAVDLWLAIDNPESPERSSKAIDMANAYNDLARWPGSPCYAWAEPWSLQPEVSP